MRRATGHSINIARWRPHGIGPVPRSARHDLIPAVTARQPSPHRPLATPGRLPERGRHACGRRWRAGRRRASRCRASQRARSRARWPRSSPGTGRHGPARLPGRGPDHMSMSLPGSSSAFGKAVDGFGQCRDQRGNGPASAAGRGAASGTATASARARARLRV